MIYNKNTPQISPFVAQSSEKLWNFISEENDNDVFCYVNTETFRLHLRIGLVVRGTDGN